MNKKKSVEPPKDDRNVAPVTKTETESAEMVEARQRAEIEKVFEIARAQAAAKALEPKSKAGLKTKSQIEKERPIKKPLKLNKKRKRSKFPQNQSWIAAMFNLNPIKKMKIKKQCPRCPQHHLQKKNCATILKGKISQST